MTAATQDFDNRVIDRRSASDTRVIVLVLLITAGLGTIVPHYVAPVRTVQLGGLRFDGVSATLVLAPIVLLLYALRRAREATQARNELEAMSDRDFLTGLPNRRVLDRWLERASDDVSERGRRPAVLFFDLDGFKEINDTHGHDVGDEVLVAVASRLRLEVRGSDQVVRFGGDEFLVLVRDVMNDRAATNIAERVIEVLEAPFEVGPLIVRISACVGVATASRLEDVASLVESADAAMYDAKRRGVGSCALYTPATVSVRTVEADELRRAIDEDQFVLHYQPIVDGSDRLVGVEALLRWEHPERGLVGPGEFVAELEKSGLMIPAGAWVLEAACTQAKAWEDAHPERHLRVSVNVSARQLTSSDFAMVLADVLRRTQVSPSRICLEITEGALLDDVDAAWSVLRNAKQRGVHIALDDFGTGFSSLSHIRRFRLDVLKVDKSFVDGVTQSAEDAAIIEHVIGMAHALGMVAVAEGVETADQHDVLARLGCDLFQGYWFSRPHPPQVIDQLLRIGDSQVSVVTASSQVPLQTH